MSDLSAIFPDLPADVIRDFEHPAQRPGPNGYLSPSGEQAQVTDDQIAQYLYERGALRNPFLPPANQSVATDPNGQPVQRTDPRVPQFVNNGRPALPTGQAYVEPPDYGNGVVDGQVIQPDPAQPSSPTPESPPPSPPPPGPQQPPQQPSQPPAPPPPPGTDEPTIGPPAAIPQAPPLPSRQQGIEALAQLWDDDPNLRNLVASYLTTGQTPPLTPPPPPQATVAPQVRPQPSVAQQFIPPQQTSYQPQPQPTQPQFDEFTDPQLKAMWERNQLLEQRLNQLAETQQAQQTAQFNQQHEHFATIVESVASQFGQKYQLSPEQLTDVRKVASRLGVMETYLKGVHPTTGQAVRPDVAAAVQTALDIAYYATPSTQQLERQREFQRYQHDQQRKQKLSGVGGSSASVARSTPPPQTPQDRHAAMVADVREMMTNGYTPN